MKNKNNEFLKQRPETGHVNDTSIDKSQDDVLVPVRVTTHKIEREVERAIAITARLGTQLEIEIRDYKTHDRNWNRSFGNYTKMLHGLLAEEREIAKLQFLYSNSKQNLLDEATQEIEFRKLGLEALRNMPLPSIRKALKERGLVVEKESEEDDADD